MIKYVSISEMVSIEMEANAQGLTYEIMMENAGNGLADIIARDYLGCEELGVIGLVGSGNNGGDTLVALARLARQGWRANAYAVRPRPENDPLVTRLLQAGGNILLLSDDPDYRILADQIKSHVILLDGVLGTGAKLPLQQDLADVLAIIRGIVVESENIHVVAVDCPSGLDCDSGESASECIPAELTITMAAIKQGMLRFPAYNLVGKLEVVGIGLGESNPYPKAWEEVWRIVPDRAWVRNAMPKRPLNAHKGTFGTALIVAGSVNYTGAAWLAGRAAYKVGAGLVTMAVPQTLHAPLAGQFPEATWLLLPDEMGVIASEAWPVVREGMGRATTLLVGPGFGVEETTKQFIANLFSGALSTRKSGMGLVPMTTPTGTNAPVRLPPVVLDADGLKLVARIPDWPKRLPELTILSPHPGEMSVLTGLSKEEIQQARVTIAERYAKEWEHIVVLKGAFTVVASPEGHTAVIPVATPALARAGTGDILAGLIAGLRAQGVEAYLAAVTGAWIHAQAGLLAARRLGSTVSVLAGDVLGAVEEVIADLHL